MVFTRSPSLITQKLRNIINRDTIIIVSIVGPIAAFLDTVTEPTLTSSDKIIAFILVALFVLVGIVRLIRGSIFDRKPLYAIFLYQAILIPGIAYFADVRSFYIFFWIIPFYLASFYYGKKIVYLSFAILAATQILKMILFTHYGYISRFEDYPYLIAEYFIVISLAILIMDTTEVSDEDRRLLLTSLETTEVEQQRLKAVMNSILDGVVALNNNYEIVSFNVAALSILDKHDNILGEDFRKLGQIESLDGSPILIENMLKEASVKQGRITYQDGQQATIEISVVPIRQQLTQEHEGLVILLRDITKQKSLEEERNAFVSLMSHELRTPLTIAEANASNAEKIITHGDTDKALLAIKSVSNEISHLTRITNEFALVIDTTALVGQIKKELLNVHEFCDGLVSDFSDITKQKGIDINLYIAPNTPDGIYINKIYFDHIVRSFTDNAIKFTASGSVTIRISQNDNIFRVDIEDTGIGISKSDQGKLFKPFYQSDNYETRGFGGLGVGLYTAKKLCDIIGGKISFTSEKDKGSVFTIKIPLDSLT